MGAEFIVLTTVAAVLAAAIVTARQSLLMVAVLAYAAVLGWLVLNRMDLLPVALGLAIALGLLGLAVVIRREASSHDVTERHVSRKLTTNNDAIADNIGP